MAQVTSNHPRVPRVAILVETHGAGRDMLRGIARYVRESGPWALLHEARGEQFVEGWSPRWMETWEGDGILGRSATAGTVDAARRAKVPTLHLLGAGQH